MNFVKYFIAALVCAVPIISLSADLTVFSAGDPVLATEINSNFSELESRITNLTSQVQTSGLAGEPFNYTTTKILDSGYTYYITDVIYATSVKAVRCDHPNLIAPVTLSGSVSGSLMTISPRVTAATTQYCSHGGNEVHLNTPIVAQGGETLSGSSLRVIGYRIAD